MIRVLITLLAVTTAIRAQYTFSRLLGAGPRPGMIATMAHLAGPSGVAWDSEGRFYFSTAQGNRVFRVNQSGVIDLVIGNGLAGFAGDGGPATADAVALHTPLGLAVDSFNNLYIADRDNTRVRKVDAVSGNISTVAGTGVAQFSGDWGVATLAQLTLPAGVAIDSNNNLFISDGSRVRKVAAGTGIIATVAGNGTAGFSGDGGPAASAMLTSGRLAVDGAGNLFIADTGNFRVRKVSTATGIITTIAGNGSPTDSGDNGAATSAGLGYPNAVAVDSTGNVFVNGQSRIRKISPAGIITTYAGNGALGYTGDGALAINASFLGGGDLAVDPSGNLLSVDFNNAIVLKISGTTTRITAVAGNPALAPALGNNGPASLGGLTLSSSNTLYIADPISSRIRQIVPQDSATNLLDSSTTISTYVGRGSGSYKTNAGLGNANVANSIPIATDPSGNAYFIATGTDEGTTEPATRIRKISGGIVSSVNLPDNTALLANAQGIAADGTSLYVTDGVGNIRKIDLATGSISTLARNTYATAIEADRSGNVYFIAGDSVGKVAAGSGTVSTIAGTFLSCSGSCDRAQLGRYSGAQLGDGGAARNATLNAPQSLRVDRLGNLYIADTGAHRIRFIAAKTGIISTIGGINAVGCSASQGPATSALFGSPFSLAVDSTGAVYVSDSDCQQVSKLAPATLVPPPPPPSYAGTLETATCQSISGWAADKNQLNQPIMVSIFDNTTLLATITANQPRPDIGTLLGDNGLHGFTFAVPAGLFDGSAHTLHVVFGTESGQELAGSPKTLTCTANYAGYIDSSSCNGISGWAADRARLNQAIIVSLWDGATQIASTTANSLRSDVGTFLNDNGLHGFSLPIPAGYLNGVSHTLQVRYETSSMQLPGSPVTLTCGSAGAPNYAGYIDSASCNGINGWVADKSRLNQSIVVSLWDGATQIASATANGSRADVGSALGDNGLHGFSIPIPAGYANGVSHTLQVRYETSATQVLGSPVIISCGGVATPNYAGWVDTASCSGISGWAADKSRLNQSIVVSLWDGAVQIASTVAQGLRSDVGGVLGDNGLHGYLLQLPAGYSNGVSHTLQVRYEASSTQLPVSPVTLTCGSTTTANYTGWVDSLSCSTISGWAADRNSLNSSINIGLYDGSTLLATTPATGSRPDVGSVIGDNGFHGFQVTTPASVKDGKPHVITVRPALSNFVLYGAQSLTCLP